MKNNTRASGSNRAPNMNAFYLVGMFFIIIVFSIYIIYKYTIFQDYSTKLNKLHSEIESIEQNNQDLLDQAEYKTSDEHIEELAREKLGLLKNNEIIFYDTNK
ncbi:MAG: septum formation initiator family protein [bacterium]